MEFPWPSKASKKPNLLSASQHSLAATALPCLNMRGLQLSAGFCAFRVNKVNNQKRKIMRVIKRDKQSLCQIPQRLYLQAINPSLCFQNLRFPARCCPNLLPPAILPEHKAQIPTEQLGLPEQCAPVLFPN